MRNILLLAAFICMRMFAHAQCYKEITKLTTRVNTTKTYTELTTNEAAGRLSAINIANCKNAQLFTVEKRIQNGSIYYYAYDGKPNSIYSGQNYSELLQSLNSNYRNNRKDVYLDLVNFNSKEEANLKSSANVVLFKSNPDVQVNALNREILSADAQDIFFHKTSKIKDIEVGEIVVHNAASKAKYYSAKVSFLRNSKKVIFEIFSDFKSAIQNFVSLLKTKFSRVATKPASLADIVSDTKQTILKKHSLSNKQLIIKFKTELSNSVLVNVKKYGVKKSWLNG